MLQKVLNDLDLFQTAEAMQFGDIHIKTDIKTGLRAIIAIHNTNLGPALGGCRCVHYDTGEAALMDAMRLAQGMSYKAAIAGIAHGGGKSVLMRPAQIDDREAYFEAFGAFVEELNGRYITAVDSGTGVADMDIVARRTRHVVSTSNTQGGQGDPSPYTAKGVLLGIQAAVAHRLERNDLEGVHVAIQGAGHVGYFLARDLAERGAALSICDNKPQAAQRIADEFHGQVVDKNVIYDVDCDVFAPCALGGVINEDTVVRLNAKIVAGAANNQLSNSVMGERLHKRGILYAPDYVINAGGLIQVSLKNHGEIEQKVNAIHATLLEIYRRSQKENQPTGIIADALAREIIENAV
jgi:leucine dehydrogenase